MRPARIDPDRDLLERFEAQLDPLRPEAGSIPARVLGYGEISTIFEIREPSFASLACKRLPLFETDDEVTRYLEAHDGYCRLLKDEVGLAMPAWGCVRLTGAHGKPVVYIVQEKLDADGFGHRLIRAQPRQGALDLVRRVLAELARVWRYNARQARVRIGIDGQMSNWAVTGGGAPAGLAQPLYLDTSTPLYRVDGREQLDLELFLRSAPSFLRWLLRALYLKDVVNRYYDFRLVAVDLAANFYKEQVPDLVPDAVAVVNAFWAAEAADLDLAPITVKEVEDYYRQDKQIWTVYQAMRRLDRALTTRLLRRPYPYILPGVIRR